MEGRPGDSVFIPRITWFQDFEGNPEYLTKLRRILELCLLSRVVMSKVPGIYKNTDLLALKTGSSPITSVAANRGNPQNVPQKGENLCSII
jgi:hypothetical protein